MRKEKLIFAAAVLCTALLAILFFAVLFFQDISLINAAAAVSVCCFLLWMAYHSLTHDCMGRKITPGAAPVQNISRTAEPPKGRFVFSEETVIKQMNRIAKRFKLNFITQHNAPDAFFYHYWYSSAGRKSFQIAFRPAAISIATSFNGFSCWFEFLDDSQPEQKARLAIDEDNDAVIFSSDILFDKLSDDEIFGIIEKIIYALYGAVYMKYDTLTSEDGKKSFTFYLDAPDYYGYTETTEIGNFKFILNKENGGTVNV